MADAHHTPIYIPITRILRCGLSPDLHLERMTAVKRCCHLKQFRRTSRVTSRSYPKICTDCQDVEHGDHSALLVCMTCSYTGCWSNSDSNHAISHYNASQHKIAFSPNLRQLHCYACSIEVPLEKSSLTKTLIRKLKSLSLKSDSSLNVEEKPACNGALTHKSTETVKSSLPGRGIVNIGNTCYLAALMQSICNLRSLQKYFALYDALSLRGGTHREFYLLSQQLLSKTDRAPVNPGMLLKVLSKRYQRFQGRHQQDSHELLRCLLSSLYEEYIDERQRFLKTSWRSWPDHITRRFLLESVPDMRAECLDELPFDIGSILRAHPFLPFISMLDNNQKSAFDKAIEHLQNGSSMFDLQQLMQPSRSIIDYVFGGLLHSKITCFRCRAVSETIEHCYDLSIPIHPPSGKVQKFPKLDSAPCRSTSELVQVRVHVDSSQCVHISIILFNDEAEQKAKIQKSFSEAMSALAGQCSVSDCLRAYFAAEILEGPNSYDCSHCTSRSSCSKKYSIERAPLSLILHLKRFQLEGRKFIKESKHVQFPPELCLKGFMRSPSEDEDYRYSLSACVVHQGGLSGGHYTSFRRATDHSQSDWLYFNDSHCSATSSKSVFAQQAYLLVYERRPNSVESISDDGTRDSQ